MAPKEDDPSSLPTTLSLSCLCGSCSGTLSPLYPSCFPIQSDFCQCPDCRYVSGQIAWTACLAPPNSTLSVSGPQTSYETIEHLTRNFCSVCGCHTWETHNPTGRQSLCAGTVTNRSGDDIFEYQTSNFVVSTLDGGFSNWVPDIPTYVINRADGELLNAAKHQKRSKALQRKPLGADEKLDAACHCGGVRFYITPPASNTSSTSSSPSSNLAIPYSESLKPHHSHPESETSNPTGEKWWLRANGTKYLAGLCACRSCRLTSGMDIQAWAFVPRANIFWAGSTGHGNSEGSTSSPSSNTNSPQPLPLNLEKHTLGTLKAYNSSPGVYRHFCSVCGATVFWRSEKRRNELIDVSAGLFRAEEGTLARRWLDWNTERVSFREDAANADIVARVEEGLRLWGKKEAREEDREKEERERELGRNKEGKEMKERSQAESTGKDDVAEDLINRVEGLKIKEG